MKVSIPCQMEVNENHVRFTAGGHVVFENYAHHLDAWQKAMVSATLKAFGQANANLAETLIR